MTVSEKVARLEPVEIDGAKWYRLEHVCDALKCGGKKSKALMLIPAEHKKYMVIKVDRYRKYRLAFTDLYGVELVITAFATEPRHKLMALLRHCDDAKAQGE